MALVPEWANPGIAGVPCEKSKAVGKLKVITKEAYWLPTLKPPVPFPDAGRSSKLITTLAFAHKQTKSRASAAEATRARAILRLERSSNPAKSFSMDLVFMDFPCMVWNLLAVNLFLQSKEKCAGRRTDGGAFGRAVVIDCAGIIDPIGRLEIVVFLQHKTGRRRRPGDLHRGWVDPLDGQRRRAVCCQN